MYRFFTISFISVSTRRFLCFDFARVHPSRLAKISCIFSPMIFEENIWFMYLNDSQMGGGIIILLFDTNQVMFRSQNPCNFVDFLQLHRNKHIENITSDSSGEVIRCVKRANVTGFRPIIIQRPKYKPIKSTRTGSIKYTVLLCVTGNDVLVILYSKEGATIYIHSADGATLSA